MSRSVSIIIVTWNALQHLKTFLHSVTGTEHDELEIIIADNGSTDGTAEWIRENHPECMLLTFPENYGYCGGNNRAAAEASKEILLFLNNDVRVEPGWLGPLLREFDDPEVAAVQPKIRSHLEPRLFEYAGAAGGFIDSMGYPFCRGRVFETVEEDRGQYDEPVDLFWASGAALAIRRELFLECGGFDERFEFHMEEVDLCWRLLNRGHRIRSAPQSVVFHLGGGTLPMGSPRKTWYNFRNSLVTLWKNATGGWLLRRFFLRLCLDGVAGLYALAKGNPADTVAIARAHFWFYRHWRQIHRDRRNLQRERLLHREPREMVRGCILFDYFLFGRKRYSEIIARRAAG